MAKNLRAKLPVDDQLIVFDVNKNASSQLMNEGGEGVRVADSVREVAEKAVRYTPFPSAPVSSMMSMFYP